MNSLSQGPLDLWLQRLALSAMVALALAILGVGVALYGPFAEGPNAPQPVSQLIQEAR